jgi:hypothetical protein
MKPVTLYMHKTCGTLKWRGHQKVIYDAWVDKLKDDQTIEVRMKINRPMKTLPQLGYYHSVMLPFAVEGFIELGHDVLYTASAFGDHDEEKTCNESMDRYFKGLFKSYKGMKKMPRKRDMTVDEFSEFIDFLLKWLAEKPGIYVPTPREM